ncbi:MAG TPA: CpaF family protein [Candidatus Dormibacteraeota bacterium]|jgi:pilus assembly protein CpaF|nr:CpaF family protein [Candidatus Dormibacteraeota bacterium]
MKLSERFDRRYQQGPAVATAPGAAPGAAGDGAVTVAPAERRIVPREGVAPPPEPTTEQIRIPEPSALLTPTLAAAKGEIHAQLLSRHAAAIDINNRAGIRRLLLQLTEDHFRSKPPAALVTAMDKERLVEILFDEVIGLGPLEALLRDPEISEIMVNRPEQIFVERRGRIELTNLAFEDEDSLRRVIDRIVSTIGRRVDESEPMCDARLKDGSRVNVVIPPVAIYGPCLTIRKFGREVLSPEKLITSGSATEAMMEYLDAAVKTRLNVIVSGGTGSGKTSLLNVLSGFIPSNERIVTCEDAAELRLRQVHVISLESKPQNVEGRGAISIRDLVRNCLRMRPDRIIVGECRGPEALDMLQAMNTGHDGSMSTLHANNPRDGLGRLETLVLLAGTELPSRAIRSQITSAVNVIVQTERLRGGARKVVSIAEVMGLVDGEIALQEVFSFHQVGVTPDGRAVGYHSATGTKSVFQAHFLSNGVKLSDSMFVPTNQPPQEQLN